VLAVETPGAITPAQVVIGQRGDQPIWFRLANLPPEKAWLVPGDAATGTTPDATFAAAATPIRAAVDPGQPFVPGRFGHAAWIVPGRELHVPDELMMPDGTRRRLSDSKQGTIEFWVRRTWDERLAAVPRVTFLDNGQQSAWCPWPLPLDEWSHVAVTWRPARPDPEKTWVHIHVDGLDLASYRNVHWAGYGAQPPSFGRPREWLREFVIRAPPGTAFAIDDLRISLSPRYADLHVDFGGQHTVNPVRFTPPDRPAGRDESTLLLLPLDGNLRGESLGGQAIEARWGG
jgi:hypothetical protein